ncbi:MAG: hypothetical protein EXS46_01960 [Candidatus Taylorbacteria bacterium]|nr:hypothetical protein [Candidatus Taylorbacteria bacterium]
MKYIKISYLLFIVVLSFSIMAPSPFAKGETVTSIRASSEADQDFHIDKNGVVIMNQSKVMQTAGTTFYTRYYIGQAFIRVLVKTDVTTKVRRRYGDQITLKEINDGDNINVVGKMETGADTLSVVATEIVNFSNQKEIAGFKGTIVGTGTTTSTLILKTADQTTITINTSGSTQIRKGTRFLTADKVINGDKIIDTVGTFDRSTNTLEANVLVVYTDMNVYNERNFQGTLKALTTGNEPTMTVTIENKDYKISLTPKTEILNNKRKNISLQRFVVGDTLRIYGNFREVDEPIIDAQLIRNLSL